MRAKYQKICYHFSFFEYEFALSIHIQEFVNPLCEIMSFVRKLLFSPRIFWALLAHHLVMREQISVKYLSTG